ncbi:Protein CKY-1 a [Aphelenchoides avenae]|nr:Protein CKY-1 a [Aphelenchus avenae]
MRGFMMMFTRCGKLLYISDNASEYLGYSVEEIMCQGDSIYDLVDSRDHNAVTAELLSGPPPGTSGMFPDDRMFICRMNLSRTAKRHIQYHKFVLVEGRYIHSAEYYHAVNEPLDDGTNSNIQPIFAAFCRPLINPENAENFITGNTSMFQSVHQMDMKFTRIDDIGCQVLGYDSDELKGTSWYSLVHPTDLQQVATRHRALCQQKDGSTIALFRMQRKDGDWQWMHAVMVVKSLSQSSQDASRIRQSIHVTYQVLSELEAATLQVNSWIYTIKQHSFPVEMAIKDEPLSNAPFDRTTPDALYNTGMDTSFHQSHLLQQQFMMDMLYGKGWPIPYQPGEADLNNNPKTAARPFILSDAMAAFDFINESQADVPLPELGDDLEEFLSSLVAAPLADGYENSNGGADINGNVVAHWPMDAEAAAVYHPLDFDVPERKCGKFLESGTWSYVKLLNRHG